MQRKRVTWPHARAASLAVLAFLANSQGWQPTKGVRICLLNDAVYSGGEECLMAVEDLLADLGFGARLLYGAAALPKQLIAICEHTVGAMLLLPNGLPRGEVCAKTNATQRAIEHCTDRAVILLHSERELFFRGELVIRNGHFNPDDTRERYEQLPVAAELRAAALELANANPDISLWDWQAAHYRKMAEDRGEVEDTMTSVMVANLLAINENWHFPTVSVSLWLDAIALIGDTMHGWFPAEKQR